MLSYLYEITHDVDGPLRAACAYMSPRARPTDTVATTYGDMTLKFHTGLRVVGSHRTGEDYSQAGQADWIVVRMTPLPPEEAWVDDLLANVRLADYEAIELDCRDDMFENRECPDMHRYGPVDENHPKAVLLHRIAPHEAAP